MIITLEHGEIFTQGELKKTLKLRNGLVITCCHCLVLHKLDSVSFTNVVFRRLTQCANWNWTPCTGLADRLTLTCIFLGN